MLDLLKERRAIAGGRVMRFGRQLQNLDFIDQD
jgi:hypothetical protein